MGYKKSMTTKIIRETFVVDGIKEGVTTAEFLQKDLNHVPQKARLTMVIQHDGPGGMYEFHFEHDQVDKDTS